jgi:hypothetical protein
VSHGVALHALQLCASRPQWLQASANTSGAWKKLRICWLDFGAVWIQGWSVKSQNPLFHSGLGLILIGFGLTPPYHWTSILNVALGIIYGFIFWRWRLHDASSKDSQSHADSDSK